MMTRHGGVWVVIPTVPGREADFERTRAAFEAEPDARVISNAVHDEPDWPGDLVFDAVGDGWRYLLERQLDRRPEDEWPRYVQFANDDMWPSDGWLDPAVEAVEAGCTPAPLMMNSRGEVESMGVWGRRVADWTQGIWTPLPFFRLDEWRSCFADFPPIHYWSDNWFAAASIYRADRPIVARTAYEFTHTWAQPRRQTLEEPRAVKARGIFDAALRDFTARRRDGRLPVIERDPPHAGRPFLAP